MTLEYVSELRASEVWPPVTKHAFCMKSILISKTMWHPISWKPVSSCTYHCSLLVGYWHHGSPGDPHSWHCLVNCFSPLVSIGHSVDFKSPFNRLWQTDSEFMRGPPITWFNFWNSPIQSFDNMGPPPLEGRLLHEVICNSLFCHFNGVRCFKIRQFFPTYHSILPLD
jgi:hypothetical protein